MKRSLSISEFLLIILGLIIKIIFRKYVSINSLISLSYTSTDSWETILEFAALHKSGLPIYDGDSIHQPPLVLLFWRIILSFSSQFQFFSLCIIDILCIYVSLNLTNEIISIFVKEQELCEIKDKSLIIDYKCIGKLRIMMCFWHVFNPFINISILSQSITCLNNFLFLMLFLSVVKKQFIAAAVFCAFMTYSSFYPMIYILVLFIGAKQNNQSFVRILIAFLTCLIALFAISIFMVGYKFISNVYLHHIYLDDSNPQMNFYWYMMATMFDHFRLFFKCTFQILLFTVSGGLAFKYKKDLVFLTYILAWTISVLKPYPSIGELGLMLALLPIYRHLFRYLRFGIVTAVMFLCVLVLGPLMHYLWMVSGTANSNFYFAITLANCAAQSHLVSSILSAYLKYKFFLQHGKTVKLSNGSELQLRAK